MSAKFHTNINPQVKITTVLYIPTIRLLEFQPENMKEVSPARLGAELSVLPRVLN
jgi:hypothetical protein